MQTTFDKETGKKTWHLTSWVNKTTYVFGFFVWAFLALMVIAFIAGFIIGIIQSV